MSKIELNEQDLRLSDKFERMVEEIYSVAGLKERADEFIKLFEDLRDSPKKYNILEMEKIRDLFDLGVTVSLGDDEIEVVGRNFNGDSESSYVENVYTFNRYSTLDDIYRGIKRKLETREVSFKEVFEEDE